ncbi:aminoacyltransferase [Absiella sp. AM54-8XD]|uniref:peptidoglycan bridge formation glycyltransferase FemA/FemB family protein n=1 Tax=unclassified Amedibacterium TaxID=3088137 RepID=UPI000E40E24F|nr:MULTISPECIES: peptidoglycan bridge formation glycyltransferase FemA/FemB family protein [unclassified Absiella]RGC20220.1 aminoacyltransferase [Absiella sp. AM54-8XD]RGC53876.1 aminoacyltransferase [Absiella sp. AM29-15]
MEFVELTENEFAQFALHHELNNLWQTTQMAKMREQRGFHTYYVGVKEDGNIIAGSMLSALPVFMGYEMVQLLRGPLIDFKNKALYTFFHDHLVEFLKARKCMYFHIDPYLPYKERDLEGELVEGGFDNSDVVDMLLDLGYQHEGFTRGIDLSREPRWIYTINLKDKTPDEVLKQMERKTLRSVKKALKYNIQVNELDRDHISVYEEVIQKTGERRGFQGRDEEYHKRLYDFYHPEGYIKFLCATLDLEDYKKDLYKDLETNTKQRDTCAKRLETQESPKIQKKMELAQEQIDQLNEKLKEADELIQSDGQVLTLASGVFFTYGREVLCLMSGVYEKYMRFASPYAMHWKMMNYAIEHGMERYNLYGMSGNFDPQAEDYGVYLFKKGFQGEIQELIGDFDYIVNPKMYRLYQSLRNVKHKIKGE